MSYPIVTFERCSPIFSTTPINKHSEVTWELLKRDYSRYEYDENIIDTFEGIAIAIRQFLKDKKIDFGLEARTEIPPFSSRLVGRNTFFVQKTLFTKKCFELPTPYRFIDPAIVAHEYTHGSVEVFNPLGNQVMGRTIIEALADIVGVIFSQYYRGKFNDWSIGDLRDLSAEKLNDGALKHAKSYKALAHELPSEVNDFGYIHYNSQILSHAFFLASRELKHDINFKYTLLRIWYNSVMTLKDEDKTYVGLRNKTIELASSESTAIQNVVTSAWKKIFP